MKRYFLILIFLTFSVGEVVAQDTLTIEKPVTRILDDALVIQAVDDVATVTYKGRNYEVNNPQGALEKTRRYFLILQIERCGDCILQVAEILYYNNSVEQTRLDIAKHKYYYNLQMKRYE